MSIPARYHRILSIIAILFTFVLTSRQNSFAQPGTATKLPQVADLFIGKWVGSGTTPEGEDFKSELIFEWTLGENFVEVNNNIDLGDGLVTFARTLYGWHPVLGQLVFWSFDQQGTINEGIAELDERMLKHEWRSFSKNGEIREWRSTLSLAEDNTSLQFKVTDTRNIELYTVNYTKQK